MNICSGVCAWATMRISSSTARTLAMPARKIAWLSARINLSMLSTLPKRLRVPSELVRIDHARHAAAFAAFASLIGPHHAAFALDGHIFLAAGHLGRQRDFKFHRRSNLHRGIGANVHARCAEISGYTVRVSGIALMNLDRQFQRESFPGPCFFPHGTSSRLAAYDLVIGE